LEPLPNQTNSFSELSSPASKTSFPVLNPSSPSKTSFPVLNPSSPSKVPRSFSQEIFNSSESCGTESLLFSPSAGDHSLSSLKTFYDLSELSDEDLDILAQVYGVQNPFDADSLERDEILARVQKIIVFEGEK
jgi:hypothetical protein